MKKAGRSHLKTSPPGIPSAFLDPISGEIMRDPVTTIDGRSYERSSIEAWLACGNRISPITKLFLSRTTILPNTALKKAIDSFLAETKKTEAAQVPTTGSQGGWKTAVENLLTLEARLSDDIIRSYASSLETDGATDVRSLADAQYTAENLVALGISRPHVKSVLKAIRTVTMGHPSPFTAPKPLATYGPATTAPAPVTRKGVQRPRSHHQLLHVLQMVNFWERLLPSSSPLIRAMGVGPQHPPMDTCQALLLILNQRRTNPEIVSEALKAIRRLLQSGHVPRKANRERFEKFGLCEIIIHVAKGWSRDVEILRPVVHIISILAGEEVNRGILGAKYGACERVADILTVIPTNDAEMHVAGLKATALLAYINAPNQERLGACGACEKVVDTMESFPEDFDIQIQGLLAIDNLTYECPNNTRRLGLYACEPITVAMASFSFERDIQLRGLRSIRNLAFDENVRKRLGACRACQRVVVALQKFPSLREVQTTGFEAIANLSCDDEDNNKALIAFGASKQICQSMLTLFSSSYFELQYHGCLAIQKLAAHQEAKEALIAAGARERMMTIIGGFPTNNALESLASDIHEALSTAHDVAPPKPHESVHTSHTGDDVGSSGTSIVEKPCFDKNTPARMWVPVDKSTGDGKPTTTTPSFTHEDDLELSRRLEQFLARYSS